MWVQVSLPALIIKYIKITMQRQLNFKEIVYLYLFITHVENSEYIIFGDLVYLFRDGPDSSLIQDYFLNQQEIHEEIIKLCGTFLIKKFFERFILIETKENLRYSSPTIILAHNTHKEIEFLSQYLHGGDLGEKFKVRYNNDTLCIKEIVHNGIIARIIITYWEELSETQCVEITLLEIINLDDFFGVDSIIIKEIMELYTWKQLETKWSKLVAFLKYETNYNEIFNSIKRNNNIIRLKLLGLFELIKDKYNIEWFNYPSIWHLALHIYLQKINKPKVSIVEELPALCPMSELMVYLEELVKNRNLLRKDSNYVINLEVYFDASLPYGKPIFQKFKGVYETIDINFGIYKACITVEKNNNLLVSGSYDGVWDSIVLNYLIKSGVKVKLINGYVYKNSKKLFKNWPKLLSEVNASDNNRFQRLVFECLYNSIFEFKELDVNKTILYVRFYDNNRKKVFDKNFFDSINKFALLKIDSLNKLKYNDMIYKKSDEKNEILADNAKINWIKISFKYTRSSSIVQLILLKSLFFTQD